MLTRSPFKDAIGKASVPKSASGSVSLVGDEIPGDPGRSRGPNGVPEVARDHRPSGGKSPAFIEPGKNLKNVLGR